MAFQKANPVKKLNLMKEDETNGIVQKVYQTQLYNREKDNWSNVDENTGELIADQDYVMMDTLEIESSKCPKNYQWTVNWKIDHTRFTDPEGWLYAQNLQAFKDMKGVKKVFIQTWPKIFRQRVWKRTRIPKEEESDSYYPKVPDLISKSTPELPKVNDKKELIKIIIKNLQEVSRHRTNAEQLSSRIGGAGDTQKIRDVIKMNYAEGERKLKDTKFYNEDVLKNNTDEKSKIDAQKIQKDIEKEIEKYQAFNTKYNIMLKKFPNPITDEVKQKYGYYDQSGNFVEQTQEEYEISKQLSKVAVSDVDIMEQIVNERNEQIRQLHSDMKVVNETFKEVANMVNEQGEMVNKIEDNTANALSATEQGVNELKKADHIQEKTPGCVIM